MPIPNGPAPLVGLGQAIREARIKRGYTLRAFAAKVGVSPPFICDLEHGRRSTERLGTIARLLGVNEHDLLAKAKRLQAKEVRWINAHPSLVKMLRHLRRRQTGPLKKYLVRP